MARSSGDTPGPKGPFSTVSHLRYDLTLILNLPHLFWFAMRLLRGRFAPRYELRSGFYVEFEFDCSKVVGYY